ncbi:MAG: aminoacyl-tRNA hydrolase [Bdellovibrionota bacterium]
MKIIAGLGNPGPKYETTRHNVGFLALDRIAELWRAEGPKKSDSGELYEAAINGNKVLLIKPQTFMNLSGKSIAPIFKFYKCEPEDLIVIHDDLDLNPLLIRIKTGGGTAGHRGLQSINDHLGNYFTGYHRIRIGIGRPAPGSQMQPADFVLEPFSDEELKTLDPVLDNVATAARMIINGEASSAMSIFNVKSTINKEGV